MLRLSQFWDAKVAIEVYMSAENIDSKSVGIDELSHIYLTYVKVLSKLY